MLAVWWWERLEGWNWFWYLTLEPLHQGLSDELLLSCTQTSVSATQTAAGDENTVIITNNDESESRHPHLNLI